MGIPSFSIKNVQIFQTNEASEILLCIYHELFGVISRVYFKNHPNAHNSIGVHIKKIQTFQAVCVHILV